MENVDLLLSDALKKLRKRKFEETLKILDKAIEIDPSCGEAYRWKAKCYGLMLDRAFKSNITEDWRLKKTLHSYERALELLPENRDVVEDLFDFFDLLNLDTLLDWKVLDQILDNRLRHYPDDIYTWYNRAEYAKHRFFLGGYIGAGPDVDTAIGYYKKVIDLVESIYPCIDFCCEHTHGTITKIMEYPDNMVGEHREILSNALYALLFEIYRQEEKEAPEDVVKYFWKRLHITNENIIGEIQNFTTIMFHYLYPDTRKPSKDTTEGREPLYNRRGFTHENFERKILQNTLVDNCFYQIKGFINTKMRGKYGETWWEDAVPEDVKKTGIDNKNIEKRHPDKPKLHEFEYLCLRDYYRIIKSNWDIFKENLGSREFIEREIIDSLNYFRNIVKHDSRLLEDTEIKELELILGKIEKCFIV